MFKHAPKWLLTLLTLWVLLVIATAFLPPIGAACTSIGDALGKVAPAIANSVPNTGGFLHDSVCDKTEKC